MNPEIERNLGEQPIAQVMREHSLKPHDLVAISSVEMTHNVVSRVCKGRRLTLNTQTKVLAALNQATGKNHTLRDLFITESWQRLACRSNRPHRPSHRTPTTQLQPALRGGTVAGATV